MSSLINAEWLNQNSLRAYPFRENMLRRPTVDGVLMDDYAIPNGLLLDFVMATNFDEQPSVYVSSLTFAGTAATIVVSAYDGTALASATAAIDDMESIPVNFIGMGVHDDIRGTAVFGNLAKISEAYPDGVYLFDKSETTLEARCVRPSLPCVSGIYVTDVAGSANPSRLRGDVALVAGQNIRLDYNWELNAIVINADNRYGYNDKCDCEASDTRTQIKTINGISVSDVEIYGVDCIDVKNEGGRIFLSDTCSKPCCGCSELAFLNQKTNEITSSLGKLEQFSQSLHDRLEDFIRNVLLSDRNLSQFI